MKQVSVEHAAKMIGVSSATMRNWVKAGHISPASTRPLCFLENSVLELKNKIGTESFGRLKTRANKRGSDSQFLPAEYVEDSDLLPRVTKIVERVKQDNLEIEPIIFLAALRLLETQGEVQKQDVGAWFDMDSYGSWLRSSLRDTILAWRKCLKEIKDQERYSFVYQLLTPCVADDFLGLLYQSLSMEGSKSEQGAYYTPSEIVEDALAHLEKPIQTFLDPCCGTGKYLVFAANIFDLAPDNIWGFDRDAIAVNIARINLLLTYKNQEFSPKIFCLDSLTELATGEIFCDTNHLIGKIDAIATNPPWGAYKNAFDPPRQLAGKIQSGETFSLFLAKSIDLLKEGGSLSFLLPESILKIKTHADIRSLILAETRIKKITLLDRRFSGVFTPVIRLDLVKKTSTDNWPVIIEENGNFTEIPQSRFKKNESFIFDVATTAYEERLLDKIYAIEHNTLANNAEWALGIVTGDNKKFVHSVQGKYAEPIFKGSDIPPYRLGTASSFIQFIPLLFQQVAPERFYRAPEKLIYKFISKKLVFAYDDKQRLTLNSANILIPSIPGMSIKVVLALLNSAVLQYVFAKKFSTHKVLRGDLEKLPFPVISKDTHAIIEHLVDLAISTGKKPAELENMIFSLFRLDQQEISIIKNSV